MSVSVAASYRKVQAGTASPAQLVVLLYDGILRHLHTAADGCEGTAPERYEIIHTNLCQARQIIQELRSALDLDNGGEIAATLDELYSFWLFQLTEANVRKDASLIQEILEIVSGLRDTWDQAAKEARRQGIA